MVNKYIQELCDDVNESHRYLDEDYDTSYEDVLDWDNSAEHEGGFIMGVLYTIRAIKEARELDPTYTIADLISDLENIR